ncbi:hypothetical protein D3C80_2010260 [compost metagenome]
MVARTLWATRIEHRQLAFEANRRTADQRFAGCHARGIDRFTGGKIVRAIEDQIHPGHHSGQRVFVQRRAMGDQADLGIDRRQALDR